MGKLKHAPRWAVLALLALALAGVRSAPAQAIPYQRPVDTAPQADTIGGGYKTPPVQKPLPRDYWLQLVDVAALAAAMGAAVWLVLRRRSRRWLMALTIGTGFIVACLVTVGTGYAMCIGVGTVYYRLTFAKR